MSTDKISSPYLIVEGSTSHDTNNSSMQTMHGTSHDTNSQTQHGLTASSVVDKTPPVPKVGHERTLLIFHAVAGLFAFLSFGEHPSHSLLSFSLSSSPTPLS